MVTEKERSYRLPADIAMTWGFNLTANDVIIKGMDSRENDTASKAPETWKVKICLLGDGVCDVVNKASSFGRGFFSINKPRPNGLSSRRGHFL